MKDHWMVYRVISFMTCILMHKPNLRDYYKRQKFVKIAL